MYELVPFQKNIQKNTLTSKIKIFAEAIVDSDNLNVLFQIEDEAENIDMGSQSDEKKRQSGLWKTTCFEVFFGPKGLKNYWELNVSPQKNWNLYSFVDYRSPEIPVEEKNISDIQISKSEGNNIIRMDIVLPLFRLGLNSKSLKSLEISFASVIEFKNKEKAYFALKHVSTKPDFHKRESFICNLE